jgi:ABC-type transport system substrate-binding protein
MVVWIVMDASGNRREMLHYAAFLGGSGMRRGIWRARFNRIGATVLVAMLPLFAIAPSVHAAADPDKVLRVAFEIAETGFDPAKVTDNYSVEVIRAVYERLLSYDYLARPVRLVPSTAEALPEITDNGRTYTLRVRQGIYFHPDLAFKGVRRELTAVDYAYSVKRFVDPAIRSPWKFLVEGKIAGLDARITLTARISCSSSTGPISIRAIMAATSPRPSIGCMCK